MATDLTRDLQVLGSHQSLKGGHVSKILNKRTSRVLHTPSQVSEKPSPSGVWMPHNRRGAPCRAPALMGVTAVAASPHGFRTIYQH